MDSSEADTAEYILDSLGGGVFYGFPLSEFITLNAGFDYERIDLEETPETPPEFSSFINEFPESDLFKLTSSIAHDTRDSLTWPTVGGVVSFSLEAAMPGSDLEYYKTNLRSAYYQPLFSDNFVMKFGGSVGYGDGFGDTPELPFFENFFAGGPTTVRGYESRSLGPQDTGDTPEPIGGAKRILATAELLFPFPGAAETRDKRLGLFVDAGQVYNQDDSFDTGEIRYSSGLSFRWISPVGPIVMSYGVPLNDEEGDEEENFQLTPGREPRLIMKQLIKCLILCVFATASAAQDDIKIGYIDGVKLIEQAPQGDAAKAALEAEFKPREQEIIELRTLIRDTEESLDPTAEDISQRQRALRELRRDLKRMQQEMREDLNLRRNEELANLQKLISDAIIEMAKQENFDLIVQDAVYASPSMDITDAVLEKLNTAFEAGE